MPLHRDNLLARLAAHEPWRAPRSETTRLAAVAGVLRYRGAEPEVLLIKRAEHPADPWSGHIAFPGGRHDEGDRDLLATAVRETAEEVGLDLGQAELAGRLDDVEAIARARRIDMVIVPHLFLLASDPPLYPDPREVDEVVWAPLEPMFSGKSATTRVYVHEGQRLELPAWRVGEHILWGLTYRMIESLFDVLRSRH